MSAVVNNLQSQPPSTSSKRLKKGIVIIAGYGTTRDGFEVDKNKITQTFTNLFNAEIIYWDNLTKKKLEENLKTLSGDDMKKKFKNVDFLAFFVLCHGDHEGQVLVLKNEEGKEPNHEGQKKNEEYNFENIRQFRKLLFGNLFKIEELDKKLKWVVVQACRGKLNDYEKDGDGKLYKDYYCISFCTGEGTVSWQPNKNGKIFIESICDSLKENATLMDFNEIMKDVHERMNQYAFVHKLKNFAVPTLEQNFDDFYFYT